MMTFEEFAGSVTREVAGRCDGARPTVRGRNYVEWSFNRARVCMKRGRHHPIEVRLEGPVGEEPYHFVATVTSEELISPLAEMILKYVTHPVTKV
jgi:hypothetical protein